MFHALYEPLPQVREVAVGVLLAFIDEKQAGRLDVGEFLAAVLDRDGGDPGVGHQHDLQLRLLRQEKPRWRDRCTSVPTVTPGR
ncbi:hypothetical protein ACH47Z_28960 [Streptomyces sp. NPDC020192]|uniref:hypothetical protein n=1 Tax=Streptomyces sp. NPDC020192 TaxID=3365066 RepID=UPI0037897B27